MARALADADAVRDDLTAKLRALDIPIVIVVGERDPLRTVSGNAHVVTVEGTGHYPQLDQASDVAAAIEEAMRLAAKTPGHVSGARASQAA